MLGAVPAMSVTESREMAQSPEMTNVEIAQSEICNS